MEQHFGTIPEVPFQNALLRYGKERAIAALNVYGHNLGTADSSESPEMPAKCLKRMVGATGIESS
jgi:hypothetical protein